MANASNTLRTAVGEAFVRGQSVTTPTDLYLSLHTASLDAAGTNIGTEVSGNGYARVALPAADVSNTLGVLSNTALIQFPQATGSWGTVVSVGVWSSPSSTDVADFYWFDDIAVPATVGDSETVQFSVGSLTFNIS